jgi:hypothetical protein
MSKTHPSPPLRDDPSAPLHRGAGDGQNGFLPERSLPGGGELPVSAVRQIDRERQLPPHRGKLDRIQGSAEGAVLALREWVELRIDLVRAEIMETIAEKQEQAKFGAIMAVFGALAGLILLLTLGFGFSAIFEATLGFAQLPALAAGYGVVVLLLAVVTFVAYLRSPFSKSS